MQAQVPQRYFLTEADFFHARCFSQHVDKVLTEEFDERGFGSMKVAKACGVSSLNFGELPHPAATEVAPVSIGHMKLYEAMF